jgi:hypothetical protein
MSLRALAWAAIAYCIVDDIVTFIWHFMHVSPHYGHLISVAWAAGAVLAIVDQERKKYYARGGR